MCLRIGIAEAVFACSCLFLTGLIALFILEWPLGLIPAVTYALSTTAGYAAYRQYAKERARAEEAERSVRFRVVETRGICPVGRHRGELIAVTGGSVSPFVCEEARTIFRMAALEPYDGKEWCCPVYDHLLVFKKEKKAAA